MIMVPHWLHFISISALLLGFATSVLIFIEEARHPQHPVDYEHRLAGGGIVWNCGRFRKVNLINGQPPTARILWQKKRR
jgi:hypothetical protein